MVNESSRAFRMKLLVSTAIALSASLWAAPSWAAGCEDMLNLKLADTTIKSAESIPAGDLTTADKVVRKNMPAFCRIVASVTDAPDSDIRIEMWLPNDGWKGVFHANGNGGFSGSTAYNYGAMEASIKRGYASAETDMGTAPATPLDGEAARRTPAEVERLGNSVDSRDGGRRQGHRQGVLWRGRQARLLHRLLDRRSAGNR